MSIERIKGRRIGGRIAGLYRAGLDDFVTTAVTALDLGFAGIEGDAHGGLTRRTGGREPWYKRGTEIRNERQLSLLAVDELQATCGYAHKHPLYAHIHRFDAHIRRSRGVRCRARAVGQS